MNIGVLEEKIIKTAAMLLNRRASDRVSRRDNKLPRGQQVLLDRIVEYSRQIIEAKKEQEKPVEGDSTPRPSGEYRLS